MLSDSSSRTSGSDRPLIASNVTGLLTNIPLVGWLIAAVFLVVPPFRRDKFVRFYALQSIFLVAAWAVLSVVLVIVISRLNHWAFPGYASPQSDSQAFLSLFRVVFFVGEFVRRWGLMFKAYHHEKGKVSIIGYLAGRIGDRGQQEPADFRQAEREVTSAAQEGLPSIPKTSIPGLQVTPPGGIRRNPAPKTQAKPKAGAVFFQKSALQLAVLAVIVGGWLLMQEVQRGAPLEGEEALLGSLMGGVFWLFVLVMSLPALVAGLFVWKGSPRLQQLCIITWLVAVSLPIAAYVMNNRFQVAMQRADEKREADIRANRQPRFRYAGPPRRITDQQKLSLVRELGNLKGHNVKIACDMDWQESTRFATDLVEVFRQAGWVGFDGEELQLAHWVDATNGPHVNVLESDTSKGIPPPDYGVVMHALSRAGIFVDGGRAAGLTPGQLELCIGANWFYMDK
jgi:uncharacterized membrane protein